MNDLCGTISRKVQNLRHLAFVIFFIKLNNLCLLQCQVCKMLFLYGKYGKNIKIFKQNLCFVPGTSWCLHSHSKDYLRNGQLAISTDWHEDISLQRQSADFPEGTATPNFIKNCMQKKMACPKFTYADLALICARHRIQTLFHYIYIFTWPSRRSHILKKISHMWRF